MKQRQLIVMAVITAVLVGIAVVTQRSRRQPTPHVIGTPVLANLDVNTIGQIVVSQDGDSVTVVRQDDVWVVTNAFNYPVDYPKLRKAVLALSELKVGQVQHGMTLPEDQCTTVALRSAEGKAIASLTLGPAREKQGPGGYRYPDGRFVQAGGETVYLVSESLTDFSTKANNWLDTQVSSVPAAELAVIEVSGPGRASLNFVKRDGKLEMLDLAENEELDSSKSYSLESVLSYLRFNNVADPELSDEIMGLTTGVTYRVKTRKGEIYTATVGAEADGGSDRFLRLQVELAPAKPTPEPAEGADEEAARAAAEAAAVARAELETEVAETQARLKGWVYLVSSHSADSMTPSREDLVKEKEVVEEPEAEASTPGPVTPPAAEDVPPEEPPATPEGE